QLDLAAARRFAAQADARPAVGREARTDSGDRTAPNERGRFYRGGVVLAILRFVARKFGERALKDVLYSMPEEARAPFVHGIDGDSWVDLDAVRTFVERVDARLGQDDLHLVLEAGRAAAEGA